MHALRAEPDNEDLAVLVLADGANSVWRVGEERGLPSAAYPLHSPKLACTAGQRNCTGPVGSAAASAPAGLGSTPDSNPRRTSKTESKNLMMLSPLFVWLSPAFPLFGLVRYLLK